MKTAILVIHLAFASVALAASAGAPDVVQAQANTMTAGEVRKVDKEQGKLTIRHGELVNLQMPAMTMVFRVKDPAMLDQVKEGDRIEFVAERVNGNLTVVEWHPAK